MERHFMAAPRTLPSRVRPARGPDGSRRSSSRRRPNPHPNARPNPAAARRPSPPSPAAELEAALDAAQLTAPAAADTFADLGLPKPLVVALAKRGLEAPFAIQARAIPDVLAGRDVLGRAQTGGGKTLAFGLPALARLASSASKRTSKAPRALVLVPTRELATQVADALRPFAETLGLKIACVFGGAPYGRQVDALNRGVDLVVATPGRLIDLIDKGSCTLRAVESTVLDEADHMADLGFLPAVSQLLDLTAPGGQRLLFSATLDRGVHKLVRSYLHEPALHAVAPAAAPIETMDHLVFTVLAEEKLAVVTEVASRPARTLIFVRTKHGADRLAKQLRNGGVEAAAIHGNLKQNARQHALDAFSAGRPRVLVATDVAARGIHVDDVDLVVHFDPPNDSKDYLHRSGRTARAGASGTALVLALPEQVRAVEVLHRDAGVTPVVVRVHPGHAAVRELSISGEPVRVAVLPKQRVAAETSPRPGQQPRTAEERFARKARARSRKPRTRPATAAR
jgi:superfamily II DNA/RNA helicase